MIEEDPHGAYVRFEDLPPASTCSVWKPMDKAPKDGTAILGWDDSFGFELMSWDPRLEHFKNSHHEKALATLWTRLPETPNGQI